jgi:hypothetical protein
MDKNLGPDQEDRGVEGGTEIVEVNGEQVVRHVPPALDGLGHPAAPEDAMGDSD